MTESDDKDIGRRGTVLVIEDDGFVAAVLRDMIQEISDWKVLTVPSEGEAQSLLDQERIDMAVLDANLFGLPAHRLATRLKERGTPFVVVTGYDPTRLPTAFLSATTLRKPVTQAQLADALREVSRGRF